MSNSLLSRVSAATTSPVLAAQRNRLRELYWLQAYFAPINAEKASLIRKTWHEMYVSYNNLKKEVSL